MAVKKIVITGRDYEKVVLPGGLSDSEERAVLQFLMKQNAQLNLQSFINKSSIRSKDKLSLFFDPQQNILPKIENADDKTIEQLLWGGLAGMIHQTFQHEGQEYDITLSIGSRFDKAGKNFFLSAMLLSWLNQNELSQLSDQVNISLEDIFHFLWVAIFKSQLNKAYETGIYKTYQYFEDNSDHIRGQIDIPRHIRLNLGLNNGKIASKYRENTTDNFMNHLIIHTYLELKKRYPGIVSSVIEADEYSRSVIHALLYQAPSYAKYDVRTVTAKLQNPISHPFFINYEELRIVCLKILAYAGVSIFDADNTAEEATQSMLFYTPDLWENYIEDRIFSHLRTDGVTWNSQVSGKDIESIVEKRPDFVLYLHEGDADEKRIILDAKYKKIWSETLAQENSSWKAKQFHSSTFLQEDICQCILYKELFHAEFTGTVFPIDKASNFGRKAISEYDIRKKRGGSFLTIGIGIPKVETTDTYQHWSKKLEAEERRAADAIKELVQEASI